MSSGIGDFTLRADPEKIQTLAGNLKNQIDKLSADFDEMLSKVESTANYWQGDAANKYRGDFKEEQPDFIEAFNRLNEHVVDLHNIAAVYTGAEQMAQNYAESLLTNVIE
jgi:WXG100 family type VII secretion target